MQAVFSYKRRNGSPSILPLQRGTLIHHSRPRKGRLAKNAVLARRVTKSREKRGFARRLSSFYSLKQSFVFDFLMRILDNPKITLRIKTRAFACKQCAFLILAIFGFPRGTPFPRDERSLTVRGPVMGGCQRARSFDSRVAVSRPNAVGRDGVVNLFALCKFCPFLLNADSWHPENNVTNRNARSLVF